MSESGVPTQVGRVLGGRYRLIAPIGVGSSGEVYLADDTKLRRQVAVKVLHRALASDHVFLRRFRTEAQTAASLNHPNIVAIHDWSDDDVPFIVTEYLGGGSLRAMLDEAGTLTPSQALLIGLAASEGLDYAHKRHVVQRDIKPGNLLFDSDANVRIADFGLAKALAEASATEPSGAVLGTIRYASPEQAQGRSVDAKSDVYSLALVLYEAVAGSLPFDNDTPIATLMARIETELDPDPEVFGPLGGAIARAASIDPARRPDAGTFHKMLLMAAEGLSRPDPLPLVGAISFDPLAAVDRDPTLLERSSSESAEPEVDTEPSTKKGRSRPKKKIARKARAVPARAASRPPKRRRWPVMLLATILLAAVGLGTYFAFQTSDVPTQVLIDAEGMTEAEFRDEVNDFWELEKALDREDDSVAGTILRTVPEPGAELEQGQLVTFFVSQGNALRSVPTNLIGMTVGEAEDFLNGGGLVLGTVASRNHEEAPIGEVLEVTTAASQLPRDSEVDVVVSSGPSLRVVPNDLVGLTFDDAESQLAVERLVATRVDVYDNNVAAGIVLSVLPEPGTELERGSPVELTVSLGRQPITVPNVSGTDILTASATLENAGLCIGETDGPANTPVIATDPPSGTTVFFGDCVRIITSQVLN